MRRLVVLCALVALGLGLGSTGAKAQFFGQLGPLGARSAHGLELAGAYVGFADHEIGASGQLRFGLGHPETDLGVQAGFSKIDNGGPTGFGAQVDLKASLFHPFESDRNFHVGGDIGVHLAHSGSTDFYPSATAFGLTIIPGVSWATAAGSGGTLSMWG